MKSPVALYLGILQSCFALTRTVYVIFGDLDGRGFPAVGFEAAEHGEHGLAAVSRSGELPRNPV